MQLNEKYRIIYDANNTILVFFEQREKQIKVKGKLVPTGEFYEFTEDYYYPNLKTALNGFLNKCTWGLETVEQVLSEIKKVETLINKTK
jgi:hypothetical protein